VEECKQRRRKGKLLKTEKRIEKDSDKAKKEYFENILQEIMQLKRAGRHEDKANRWEKTPWDSQHWH
jgi:hypothetical protein